MSGGRLTLMPAGAGSGKTFSLTRQLAEALCSGVLRPDGIVAVTFTEVAATELRERLRTELLQRGRVEQALQLDQSCIATLHGLGLRLLEEFAFEAGVSPRLRLLDEAEQQSLVRIALARSDALAPLLTDLPAFGYANDPVTGLSAEDKLRAEVLRLAELMRALGPAHDPARLVGQTGRWLDAGYGATEDAAALTQALHSRVEALLDAHPQSLAGGYGTNRTAITELDEDYQQLCRARDARVLATDWVLWERLGKLRRSKRGTPLPADYDALAVTVVEAATRLSAHPGPLRQAHSQFAAMAAAAQSLLEHYSEAKREAGAVDYGDMIALAGALLHDTPGVLPALRQRVQRLVVDEFQDTSPQQFSLVWPLHDAGVETVLVGDLKQAIMGFQGADPRLFEALLRVHADSRRPLGDNWRSRPRLVEFVNALGPGLFGEAYDALDPKRPDSEAETLEVIDFASRPRAELHAHRAHAVAGRIRELLGLDGPSSGGGPRAKAAPLRGSELAVLCPTHAMLTRYAEVLRGHGLRVRLQASGWYTSREVEIALHALAYVGNPCDRHAALYLAVTELGSHDLQSALDQLMRDGRIEEPLLAPLRDIARTAHCRGVHALVGEVLHALALFDKVACWPWAAQARANLLRLLSEAGQFMQSNPEALAAAGWHGSGLPTFLSWLAARAAEKDGDLQPDARVVDEDAIELTTWHSAKGREWPVVFLCGLDRDIKARLPDTHLGYDRFEPLSALMEHARIEWTPAFAASVTRERFLHALQQRAESEARRLLYVGLTRAREKLVLEWPGYLAQRRPSARPTTTAWSLLSQACGLVLEDDALRVGGERFACRVERVEGAARDTAVPRGEAPPLPLSRTGRRALRPGRLPAVLTPDSQTPSQAVTEAGAAAPTVPTRALRYGPPLHLDTALGGTRLGLLAHRCFELLPERPQLAGRMGALTGLRAEPMLIEQLQQAVERFEHCLTHSLGRLQARREWPVLALDANGTVVHGVADLVVYSAAGIWVIDHKSDGALEPEQGFAHYRPQLQAYADALHAGGQRVQGVGINWIRRGVLTLWDWTQAP